MPDQPFLLTVFGITVSTTIDRSISVEQSSSLLFHCDQVVRRKNTNPRHDYNGTGMYTLTPNGPANMAVLLNMSGNDLPFGAIRGILRIKRAPRRCRSYRWSYQNLRRPGLAEFARFDGKPGFGRRRSNDYPWKSRKDH